MKQLLFYLVFILTAAAVFPQVKQLKNFDELMTELKSGEIVRVIIHYGKCEMQIDGEMQEAPDAIGGMNFNTFEYFATGVARNEKAYITSSESVLIGHGYYGYVINYAKIRVYEDNTVEIIARYLDPTSYEVKMDETFTSTLNDGTNEGAVYLFE